MASANMNDEQVMTHVYDADDAANNEAWVQATVDRFGRIDGLVNNAGIDEDAYDRMWAVNAKAPLRMIHLALPRLKAVGSGRMINVSSLSGKRIANVGNGYTMSKFAVMALSHGAHRAG